MQRRTFCAARVLYGLGGLGALGVAGGCGDSATDGVRPAAEGELKERSVAHGKRMMEYYNAKNAEKGAGKRGKAAPKATPEKADPEKGATE
jgi:hypothetical protein